MAIAFRDISATASTSTALPAAQAGDLLVAVAYRDNNQQVGPQPTGWTQVNSSNTGGPPSIRFSYRYWQSGDTAPTWSNATAVVIASYSGVDQTNPIGAVSVPNTDSGTGTDIGIPALTLSKTDGTSWVVAGYEHRMSSSLSTPTGMVERVDAAHNVVARYAYSGAPNVTSFAARTSTATASAAWRAAAIELLAAPDTGTPVATTTGTVAATADTTGTTLQIAVRTGSSTAASALTGTTVQVALRTGVVAASSSITGTTVEVEQASATASATSSVTGTTQQVAIRTGTATAASSLGGTTDAGTAPVVTTGAVSAAATPGGNTIQVAVRVGQAAAAGGLAGTSRGVAVTTGAITAASAVVGQTSSVQRVTGTVVALAALSGTTYAVGAGDGVPVATPRLIVVPHAGTLELTGTDSRLAVTTRTPSLHLGAP